jgi:hypothetical protein
LFEAFTGSPITHQETIDNPHLDTVLKIGYVDGVMYETVRDNEKQHYLHKFKKSARPILVSAPDGSKIQLVGGNYSFTNRGIVDN